MGNALSSILSSTPSTIVDNACRARKRKRSEDDVDSDSESEFVNRTLQTAKRQKTICTSQYLYKTLFQKGEGSDITVVMLNKAWKLHKLFICQSPYFDTMFNGSWIETNKKVVDIEITDPNITLQSLSVVLGTYYSYEVDLQPTEVIANLATARFFLHPSLVDECVETMIETMNPITVFPYLEAANTYDLSVVRKAAKNWLEINIMNPDHFQASFLRSICPDLMTELVASPNLVALQTEFGIYSMLKHWIFVHLNKNTEIDWAQIDLFYEHRTWSEPFLLSDEGKQFAAPFTALRHKHLVLHVEDVDIMHNDLLIPPSWLHDAFREQWLHTLRVNTGEDQGPKSISEEEFAKECFRWGRYIEAPADHVWRWKGFYHGLDLVVSVDKHKVKVCRNHCQESDRIQDNHVKHSIMLKANLINLNEQRQIEHMQTSGVVELTLHKNETKKIMTIDKALKYPLFVSFNVLMVTPFNKT